MASEQQIMSAFEDMHKNTLEKQKIDCGACGYDSCRKMAQAVALGMNRKENCMHKSNSL